MEDIFYRNHAGGLEYWNIVIIFSFCDKIQQANKIKEVYFLYYIHSFFDEQCKYYTFCPQYAVCALESRISNFRGRQNLLTILHDYLALCNSLDLYVFRGPSELVL